MGNGNTNTVDPISNPRDKKKILNSDNIKCWGGNETTKTHTLLALDSVNHKIHNYHEPIQ